MMFRVLCLLAFLVLAACGNAQKGEQRHSDTGIVADTGGATDTDPPDDEVCDGIDNDGDGLIDEDDAVDASTWYVDSDGDGFGHAETTVQSCELPSGFSEIADDCDDTKASVNPGALEYCNDIDDDCDGRVDEDEAVDASDWYIDNDEDGFGDVGTSLRSCTALDGYVDQASDCDDRDSEVNPDAIEVCDGKDNDCNGIRDTDSTEWNDADNDGTCDGADAEAWNHVCDGIGTIGNSWDNVSGWTGDSQCENVNAAGVDTILTSRQDLLMVEYEVRFIAAIGYDYLGEGSTGIVLGYNPEDATHPYIRVRFQNLTEDWSGLVIEEWDGAGFNVIGSLETDSIDLIIGQFELTVTEDPVSGDATMEFSLQEGTTLNTWDNRADELHNLEVTWSSGFAFDGAVGFYTDTWGIFDTIEVEGLR